MTSGVGGGVGFDDGADVGTSVGSGVGALVGGGSCLQIRRMRGAVGLLVARLKPIHVSDAQQPDG